MLLARRLLRATSTLDDYLSQAEEHVKSLSIDVQSMEAAKDHAFTPPPRAWTPTASAS